MWRPLFGWKAILGGLVVVAAMAAAVAVVGLGQIHQITHYLRENKSVKVKAGVLAPTSGLGGPETILLVGDDTRSGQSAYKDYTGFVPNLANETLLVRLDPAAKSISMLSIPRELLTTIDCPAPIGTVQNRFNYSLACGGFTTLVSTIKQMTGLSVNHVVEIDFENFEKAINELGCVYYQVDENYYNDNIGTAATDYQSINLPPGYQKLCGTQAEQFVSFRHTDLSTIRDARDQTFLEAARQQYASSILSHVGTFERIFGQLVFADNQLKTTAGVEDLIATVVGTAGYPIRQVQVPDVNTSPTNPAAIACTCSTAPESALLAAAHSFLDGSAKPPSKRDTAKLAKHSRKQRALLALSATTAAEAAPAVAMQHKLSLRVEFPRVQVSLGVGLPLEYRNYEIHAPDGTPYPAFVEVFPIGLLGQYLDVEGTTWTAAPALAQASQSITVDGTTYYLQYSGAHITQVAWYENHAAYWVHNTLVDGVSNGQMLAIAEQTVPVTGPIPQARAHLRLKATAAPKPVIAGASSNGTSRVGVIFGVIGLLVLIGVGGGFILNRQRVTRMRRRRENLDERIERLEAALARVEPPAQPGAQPVSRSAPSRSTSPGSGRGPRTPAA